MTTSDKPAQCYCDDGWVCEDHSDKPWPHDDCAGPGMICEHCGEAWFAPLGGMARLIVDTDGRVSCAGYPDCPQDGTVCHFQREYGVTCDEAAMGIVPPPSNTVWRIIEDEDDEVYVGPLRWRGALNLKDITERVIASIIGGIVAAFVFYGLVTLL